MWYLWISFFTYAGEHPESMEKRFIRFVQQSPFEQKQAESFIQAHYHLINIVYENKAQD